MGWNTTSIKTRRYYCPNDGDLTDRLSSYTRQMDIGFCPDCGVRLTVILGGENTTKSKKLKVMHEVKAEHAQEVTAEPKAKTKKTREPKNGEALEKAYQALKDLGGGATSPQLVEKLCFSGESARDQVRRLMDKLHAEHRIHRTKEGKVYHFKIAEPKTVEVAAA